MSIFSLGRCSINYLVRGFFFFLIFLLSLSFCVWTVAHQFILCVFFQIGNFLLFILVSLVNSADMGQAIYLQGKVLNLLVDRQQDDIKGYVNGCNLFRFYTLLTRTQTKDKVHVCTRSLSPSRKISNSCFNKIFYRLETITLPHSILRSIQLIIKLLENISLKV